MEFLGLREPPMTEHDARMMDSYSFRPVESAVDGALDKSLNAFDEIIRAAIFGFESATLLAPAQELGAERHNAFAELSGGMVVAEEYIPNPPDVVTTSGDGLWSEDRIQAFYANTNFN